MKILAIGNSHIGALVRAWTLLGKEHPDLEFSFVGSNSERLREAEVVDGALTKVQFKSPKDPRAVADYDAFVVIADFPAICWLVISVFRRQFSRQVEVAAVADIFDSSVNAHVLRQLIRPHSARPVVMLSRPERRTIGRRAVPMEMYSAVLRCVNDVLAQRGVSYIPQPRQSLDDSLFPLSEYYDGAVSLSGGIARDQAFSSVGHLNAQGGVLLMREVIPRVRAASGTWARTARGPDPSCAPVEGRD